MRYQIEKSNDKTVTRAISIEVPIMMGGCAKSLTLAVYQFWQLAGSGAVPVAVASLLWSSPATRATHVKTASFDKAEPKYTKQCLFLNPFKMSIYAGGFPAFEFSCHPF